SPDDVEVTRLFGAEMVSGDPTQGRASFAHVSPGKDQTIAGSGDIGRDPNVEDTVKQTLSGILIGMIAVVALAVLFMTSEFRRNTIWLTLAASPRRGRVLAAKAVVIGAAGFAAGLLGALGALALTGPMRRSAGLPSVALTDGRVIQAILGSGALLAVIAVFALSLATIFRRSAPAIAVTVLLLLLPQILATGLPLAAAKWLTRLTPAAGFAAQDTVERYDTAIGPWQGLGVLCVYTALALAGAVTLLRRRDA
ncbi:MAG: ABC transporter permease subunit, partial [Streptosporangiaceae bacterium]